MVEYKLIYELFENVSAEGVDNTDFIIPDGKRWVLKKFGGGANEPECRIELLYSSNGGTDWNTSPFCSTSGVIFGLDMEFGCTNEKEFVDGAEILGSGTDVRLRLKVYNYNTATIANIGSWLEIYEK